MSRAFREGGPSNAVVEKLIRLIRSKPDETFVVFTYLDRSEDFGFRRTILKRIDEAGLNYWTDDGPRIAVTTWGMETGTNAYRHAQNVVLLGVIFQPHDSVA